jgi:hypothetical protein
MDVKEGQCKDETLNVVDLLLGKLLVWSWMIFGVPVKCDLAR